LFSAVILVPVSSAAQSLAASQAGGTLEKSEIVLAYPQPSVYHAGVWSPRKRLVQQTWPYGLKVKLQQLNPQSSVPAVIRTPRTGPSPLEEI
jgi:hypothetical protein